MPIDCAAIPLTNGVAIRSYTPPVRHTLGRRTERGNQVPAVELPAVEQAKLMPPQLKLAQFLLFDPSSAGTM